MAVHQGWMITPSLVTESECARLSCIYFDMYQEEN